MSSKKYTADEADAYLFGQMQAEDQKAFDTALSDDPELASMVAQQRLEHEAMALLRKDDFRRQLQTWQAEKSAPSPLEFDKTDNTGTFKLFSKSIVQMAAAACVLFIAGYFVLRTLNAPDYPQMASNYFDQTTPTVRGSSDQAVAEMPEALQQAVAQMMSKDYANAVRLLETAPDAGFRELKGLLMIECYFHLKKYDDALAICDLLQQPGGQPDTQEKAAWYSVLCLLGKGETGAIFQQKLNLIANDTEHSFVHQAQQLKSEL